MPRPKGPIPHSLTAAHIPTEHLTRLRALAAAEDRTVSHEIRAAIRLYLATRAHEAAAQ